MSIRWFLFKNEKRAVFRLEGDLKSVEEGDELLESVDPLITDGIEMFHLDFTHARYVSSFGIAVLIRLKKKLLKAGAQLKLLQVNKEILRVLTVTRTASFLLGTKGEV